MKDRQDDAENVCLEDHANGVLALWAEKVTVLPEKQMDSMAVPGEQSVSSARTT